jgi:hypothetical protein
MNVKNCDWNVIPICLLCFWIDLKTLLATNRIPKLYIPELVVPVIVSRVCLQSIIKKQNKILVFIIISDYGAYFDGF